MKTVRFPVLSPDIDLGLLFLRLAGSFLLCYVHGVPKVLHYKEELLRIEDPFSMGAQTTLIAAIAAEVICPVLIAVGWLTRLAALPIIFLLLVSMIVVHPEWSIAEGQFGWLLLTIFVTIAVAGPGKYTLAFPWV